MTPVEIRQHRSGAQRTGRVRDSLLRAPLAAAWLQSSAGCATAVDVDSPQPRPSAWSSGLEVERAHAYLSRSGYFPNPNLAAQYPDRTPIVPKVRQTSACSTSTRRRRCRVSEQLAAPVDGRARPRDAQCHGPTALRCTGRRAGQRDSPRR